MPHGFAPSVFISSTCYDLSQIRADLKRSVESIGLDPVVSESFAFPIDPDVGTIENCVRVVQERADVFVLIVGARYGNPTKSGHSVTNLEYLEARAKGIPVYVFVSNVLLHQLPIWKKYPDLDYSGIVDNPKLFEFVETVRTINEHWVFGFDEARQICDTLRTQLAFLFMDALLARKKVTDAGLPSTLAQLPSQPLRLLIERPSAWEYLFFASVLENEFKKNSGLQWDVKYAIRSGHVRNWVTDDLSADICAMNEWIQQKLAGVGALVDSTSALMNTAIQEAMGPPGVPGDPEHILYVAQRIAHFQRRLLEWTIDFHDVEVRPECERALQLMARFSDDVIEKLSTIPPVIRSEIAKALGAKNRGETYVANIMFKLSIPPSEELSKELEALTHWIQRQASRQLKKAAE